MTIILIIEEDLGFLFWLGQALTSPDLNPLPARSVLQAQNLIRRFKVGVDLVIASPELPRMVDYARHLRKQRPQLGLIAALGYASNPDVVPAEFDAGRPKPNVRDGAEEEAWRQLVRRVLSNKTNGSLRRATGQNH